MFRVKTSQANTVNFTKRPVFLVDDSTRKNGAFFVFGEKVKVKSANVTTIFLVAVAAFGACRASGNSNSDATTPSSSTTRQVTDDLGRTVTIPAKITRIVSLAPSLTESVFVVGAGDRLVGVTSFCNYPEQAKEIAKIGDTTNPNIESIIALKPDIVLVSTASQIETFTKTLADNGIAVFVTNPNSLEDVFKNLYRMGDIFGTSATADGVVTDLKRRVNATWDKVGLEERTLVFVQISKEPLFTIGKESFLNAFLVKAGGQSVTSEVDTAYPKLSKETASTLRPEAIILSDSDDNKEPNEVFKNSPAVKSGRVFRVNADLLSRPGPRLVDALELIAKDLHPNMFRND